MRNNPYQRARFRLAMFYSGSIILLLIVFSIGVYMLFEADVTGELDNAGSDVQQTDQQVQQQDEQLQVRYASVARQQLLLILGGVDIGTSLLAIWLGWFLAGRTLSPLQAASRKQERFIADAAHELRTPLSVMKAGLETIEAGGKPEAEDYQRLNGELREEIDRVVALSNDLLFLSRSDQVSLPGTRLPVDISAVCSRQVEIMLSYAGQRGIQLKSDIQPLVRVSGDEDQLNRLVQNLLKNAVDYNREGGDCTLTLTRSSKKAVIQISDTGIGMDPEDLPHVCERFYKTEQSREKPDTGSGLGLSIAEEIVRFHGGRMKMDSTAGVGTKVTIMLDAF